MQPKKEIEEQKTTAPVAEVKKPRAFVSEADIFDFSDIKKANNELVINHKASANSKPQK